MTTHWIGQLVSAGAVAVTLCCAWVAPVSGQGVPRGFPSVVNALKAAPGCLGVETGQTASGRQVIFAWFDGKKSLVDWYHSDVHQRAMKSVFPNTTFDRQPLPELPEDTGTILAIVSVNFAEAIEDRPRAISSIGIELYGPLPGGVAVGGRFAPEVVKVRGLREIPIEAATRPTR